MSVVVRLPGVLRELCGGGDLTVPVPMGGTLADVLDDVSRRHPLLGRRLRDETGALRRYVNVYLGEDDVRDLQGLATPVPDGAQLQVLPSVAGG